MRVLNQSIVMLIFGVFFLLGCRNVTPAKNISPSVSDDLLGKSVIFNKDLRMYTMDGFYHIDSLQSKIENKVKVVSIIDGQCPKCIINLNSLDSLFMKSTSNTDFELIFVLNVSDSLYFMQHLYQLINSESNIVLDNNFSFEKTNDILVADIYYRTFLLDVDDKIVLLGNPLIDRSLLDDYISMINSMVL